MSAKDNDIYVHAGGLLMFSSGEYSDYGTMGGCFVALEPLTRTRLREIAEQVTSEQGASEAAYNDAVARWRTTGTKPDGGHFPSGPFDGRYPDPHGMFIEALIRAGLLLAVTYTELHVGSYSRLELSL